MKKIKILTVGLFVLILSIAFVNNVFAKDPSGINNSLGDMYLGRTKNHPHNHKLSAPEPISYALLLVGGGTLVALRRWKAKRSQKNLEKQHE